MHFESLKTIGLHFFGHDNGYSHVITIGFSSQKVLMIPLHHLADMPCKRKIEEFLT
jgi:hypothetical protein